MCGRFFVDSKSRELDRYAENLPPDSEPFRIGEVFPTNGALVLGAGKEDFQPSVMKWGLPHWKGNGVIFNTRSENALVKPFFRKAVANSPIAVPVSGFYEWRAEPGQKNKRKYLFTNPDGSLLYLAALWDRYAVSNDKSENCFSILTTDANASVKAYHNRMPIWLDKNGLIAWLDGASIPDILHTPPGALDVALVD